MPRLAIIPARGGSKRIPRKNIRPFLGKPIMAYSIELALDSDLFDKTIVSTDDEEIGKVAMSYGADVPFLRSNETASDTATTADALIEVIQKLDMSYEEACCIYATAPLLTKKKLQEGYQHFKKGQFDSVFPVTRFSYPIQRALSLDSVGKLEMIQNENLNSPSQELVPAYHDCGMFYWFSPEKLENTRALIGPNSGGIVFSSLEVQDIDEETDWQMAEIKYKMLFG